MTKEHHNIDAPVPTIGQAVRFFLHRGYNPRIIPGSVVPDTAHIKFETSMPNPAKRLFKTYTDSGWGFTYEPLKPNGRGGYSNAAVFLMLVTL
jgi:hypothetical protein